MSVPLEWGGACVVLVQRRGRTEEERRKKEEEEKVGKKPSLFSSSLERAKRRSNLPLSLSRSSLFSLRPNDAATRRRRRRRVAGPRTHPVLADDRQQVRRAHLQQGEESFFSLPPRWL